MNTEVERELDDRRMRLDALLAEYHAMHEMIQNHANFMRTRENLFVVLSFGILAYTVAYQVEISDLINASLASIAVFKYYIHASENAIFVPATFHMQISDIEE